MRSVLVAIASLGLLLACSNPCDKLLDKLCGCPGERAKAACVEARTLKEARDKAKPDTERCKAQLGTFKCEQLN